VLWHAASLIAQTEAGTGAELPHVIKDEFDAFLECGIRWTAPGSRATKATAAPSR
jgi:hypothetical protein